MERRMVRRLVTMAVAVALTMAVAPPAGAGPAIFKVVRDFETNALDADGCFRLVHCSRAYQFARGDKVIEFYQCEFVEDDFWGLPTLPGRPTMMWDYRNTADMDYDDACPLGDAIEPPWRWFSDVEDILNPDLCWMYTNPAGEDIGDSSWRMVIRQSGKVRVRVVYDPPTFEGPEC